MRNKTIKYAYAYNRDYQGNIRAVIDPDGAAIQATDYYPYGLPMPTSTAAANRYKYGAKELETREGLNFHDFEARMLFNDHTLFARPDDKAGKYPGFNPYLYCAANPLRYVDPTGKIIRVCDTNGSYEWKECDGVWGFYNSDNILYNGNNTFVNNLSNSLSKLMQGGIVGNFIVSYLALNENIIDIMPSNESKTSDTNQIGWNSTGLRKDGSLESVPTTDGLNCNPTINLGHEMTHVIYNITNGKSGIWLSKSEYNIPHDISYSDIFTTHFENLLRSEQGLPLRTHYLKDQQGKGLGPDLIDATNNTSVFYDFEWNTDYKPLSKNRRPHIYR